MVPQQTRALTESVQAKWAHGRHSLKNVGGLSFSMMMPILAGYIAMSIGERPALMPGIVGGFLATTGGSGFFGALFAGFIAGYLIIFLKKALSHLPEALDGTKSILFYPVLGLVLIGVIMTYIINPPCLTSNLSRSTFL